MHTKVCVWGTETGKARRVVLMLELLGSDQTFTLASARINYLVKCKCFNPTRILFTRSTLRRL